MYEQNLSKQTFKRNGIHDCTKSLSNKNIAQDSINAKVTSPSLELWKTKLEYVTKRKDKMQLLKESVRSRYLPKLK
jgi:hypothetical protein